MRVTGTASWQIRVTESSEQHERALWIRNAERIPVRPSGRVPEDLDLCATSTPTTSVLDPAAAAEAWTAWWTHLLETWASNEDSPGTEFDFSAWPGLRDVVLNRLDEARTWSHTRQQMRSSESQSEERTRTANVVKRLERELGQKAPPFRVSFLVLPVLEDELRPVRVNHYLVPERIYRGAAWPAVLRDLIRPLMR